MFKSNVLGKKTLSFATVTMAVPQTHDSCKGALQRVLVGAHTQSISRNVSAESYPSCIYTAAVALLIPE